MNYKQQDSDDDLPEINLNPDSPNKSDSSKNDFEMPEADVLLAQRLRLAKQLKDIERGKETIAEVDCVETAEEKEIDNDLEPQITTKKLGFMPTLPLDPLCNILQPLQYAFLENFVKVINCDLKTTNVVDVILSSLEGIISQEQKWELEDVVVVGIVLAIICTCHVCAYRIRNMSRAQTLLYYLLQEVCTDSFQVTQMGKAITKLMTQLEHRMEFVTILEGREGDHVRSLSVGIIRNCLDELLLEYVSDEWITTPYTIATLLPIVSQKWGQLQFNQQLLLAELLSRNLKLLEDFSDSNENLINDAEDRMKLLMVLGSNIDRTSSVNDRCKLQILVSRMQIYQSKIVGEIRDDNDAA